MAAVYSLSMSISKQPQTNSINSQKCKMFKGLQGSRKTVVEYSRESSWQSLQFRKQAPGGGGWSSDLLSLKVTSKIVCSLLPLLVLFLPAQCQMQHQTWNWHSTFSIISPSLALHHNIGINPFRTLPLRGKTLRQLQGPQSYFFLILLIYLAMSWHVKSDFPNQGSNLHPEAWSLNHWTTMEVPTELFLTLFSPFPTQWYSFLLFIRRWPIRMLSCKSANKSSCTSRILVHILLFPSGSSWFSHFAN